ncbi:MAG: hypothetical protein A3K59_04325 [Euryarchaeota archaeon RBG_19FT_COMBO_69_17]|nr:MAG: hypothetical protein A3K59_04325 [Euryarchaeota archaeon RBG_19FT_COMBO_69_17]
MHDAIVVGAGPAGGMAARRIAAAGFRTLVLEKKRVVGEPVQCAEGVSHFGLVSNGLRPSDEWVVQGVRGARCFLPGGSSFTITDLPGYSIDRARFDRWIVQGAVDTGADLRTGTRVTGLARTDRGWRVRADGESFDARVVIGADGPTSLLGRIAGCVTSTDLIRAYEYRFPRGAVAIPEEDRFHLFVAQRYEGGYAWVFPRGDEVNVGAGGHIDAYAATMAFCRERGIDPGRRIATIAGTIPYRFDVRAYALPGFAIAGDAAGVTNPMNGAGIHPGLFTGRHAGACAAASLADEDPDVMLEYDRIVRASPFVDPVLLWAIERFRTWDDGLLDSVGAELDGRSWRDVDLPLALSVLLRKPWLVPRSRSFLRILRALDLCERYGW